MAAKPEGQLMIDMGGRIRKSQPFTVAQVVDL